LTSVPAPKLVAQLVDKALAGDDEGVRNLGIVDLAHDQCRWPIERILAKAAGHR
jgi:hypothetical protein